MILVISGVKRFQDVEKELLKDAELLAAKLQEKGKPGYRCFVLPWQNDLLFSYARRDESEAEYKIHVIAHGNLVQVGLYNVDEVCGLLLPVLDYFPTISRISLLSCDSALPGEESRKSLAEELCEKICAKRKADIIRVKGCNGHAFTDFKGRTLVWNSNLEEHIIEGYTKTLRKSEPNEEEQKIIERLIEEGCILSAEQARQIFPDKTGKESWSRSDSRIGESRLGAAKATYSDRSLSRVTFFSAEGGERSAKQDVFDNETQAPSVLLMQ